MLVAHAPVEEVAPDALPAPPRRRWASLARQMPPYLYLTPALVVMGVWVYRPLLLSLTWAFYRWNLLPTRPRVWVGLTNFRQVLTQPQLWQALEVTGLYLLGMAVFLVGVPVAAAGLSEGTTHGRGRRLYRAAIFVPVLVSPVVAGTLWSFLLAPNGGIVDRLLGHLGMGDVNWLVEPGPARAAVVLVAGWKMVGLAVLLVEAGLAGISAEYLEAAAVDGASRWRSFWRVTLPLLSPTVVLLLIVTLLLTPPIIFPLVNSLTQGGPNGATTDIYYYVYVNGFNSADVGNASAAAVLFFLAFIPVVLGGVRLLERLSFLDR
ncbi:MAG TPA: sugar ABC transporter permease [Candidatus Dormibacteraeota bacterium]|nr:sugar ABC transporter permease [Candidatus Dormibacteraeota bacterium]